MRAGLLRNRITIQTNAQTVDSFGDLIAGWTDLYAGVPATVTPQSGKEGSTNDETTSEVTHKITLRYLPNITTKHRVYYDSRSMDIQSVINTQERSRTLVLMCVERV